jgi:Dehydrogenases with different specificities (related to short-chain alcohol dehydrogenases)
MESISPDSRKILLPQAGYKYGRQQRSLQVKTKAMPSFSYFRRTSFALLPPRSTPTFVPIRFFSRLTKPGMSAEVATQRRNLPLLATTETCSGGTYIVTGANTGLGFEAAKHLVALGAAKVVMGVRNVSAGETAKAEIEKATGQANVADVWALDLASYESVKAFAKRAIAELDRVDAVIENAAVAISHRVVAEGHILPSQLMCLAHFSLRYCCYLR